MINSIVEYYKRWRHSRGYGVHSPFAYDLVKSVIRIPQGYAYYGYEDIDVTAYRSGIPVSYIREAEMLLRLAAYFDVKRAFMPPESEVPYRSALLAANSRMEITTAIGRADRCSLICTTDDYLPLEKLLALLNTPGRIFAIRNTPEGWSQRLFDALEHGVMLYDRHRAIIVSRPEMQKVAYSIKF